MKFSEIGKKKAPPVQETPKKPAETPAAPTTKPTEIKWPSRPSVPPPAARPIQSAGEPAGEIQTERKLARQIYGQVMKTVADVIDRVSQEPIQAAAAITASSEALVQALSAENQALLALAATATPKDYLYGHSVNTAIFAIWTGRGFGWSARDLESLGTCALIADIGMTRFKALYSQPRELSEPERAKLRLHPLESQKLLDQIEDMDKPQRQWISEVIGQEYAWKSGRGPTGTIGKGPEIQAMARVLGQCDIFEAMTHPRAWRKAISAHEMIKTFLKQPRDPFGAILTKNFVERFSLFPPGSFVQLSTLECGYSVSIHPQMPTRPTVELLVRSDGAAYSPPQITDLVENPTTHITGAIEESQAGIKDPDFLKQLESSRWWTE